MAWAYIVDVLEFTDRPVLLMEHVPNIEDADAKVALEHMGRRIHFVGEAAKMQGTSTNRTWTN